MQDTPAKSNWLMSGLLNTAVGITNGILVSHTCNVTLMFKAL